MSDAESSTELLQSLKAAFSGQYDVERPLGAGGMGTVYLAKDMTLDRQVAIKVIVPELAANRAFRQRFLSEARTVAKLRHPNIVAVHAAGEVAGSLYFVMEYVPGESLRDVIDREPIADRVRGTAILRDLASALEYAHEHGVVHRDIKPENILIDKDSGRAMLTDFGVAGLTGQGAADERMTGIGMIVGSPRYMSPEQAAGERQLDGRSDIYSLGLVGYEMFSGGPAFAGTGTVSIITRQITEKPAPLGEKTKGVPPAVAASIDKALEKDPANRWQTGGEFARALAQDTPSLLYLGGRRSARQRRTRLLIAGAIAGVLLVGIPIAWRLSASGAGAPEGVDPRKSFFVAPFENQTSDPSLGWLREGSVNMLTLNLSSWSDLTVVDYERTLDLLRDAGIGDDSRVGLEAAREIAREAGVWTVVLGQITRGSDSLRVTARVFDVASGKSVQQAEVGAAAGSDPRGLFDKLSRELLDLAGAPPMTPEMAKTTTSSLEAYKAYLTGVRALNGWEFDVADSALARAINADSTFALAHYKRALLLGWNKKNFTDTSDLRSARLAAEYGTRLPQRERGLVDAFLSVTQGINSSMSGDTTKAKENLGAAQQKYAALLGRDSTDAEAWYGLGDAYFHSPAPTTTVRGANWTRSLRAFNRTLALDSSFHLAYPHTLQIYNTAATQGQGLIVVGDSAIGFESQGASQAYGRERILAARQTARVRAAQEARRWVDTDPEAPEAHLALADAYVASNDPAAAAAALRLAMSRPTVRAPDILYRIATMEVMSGKPLEALTTLRDAMRRYGADSLAAQGGLRQYSTLTGSAAIAAYAGSISDMNAVFALVEKVVPTLPVDGQRGGVPSSRATKNLAVLNLLAMGIELPKLRKDIDETLKAMEAFGKVPLIAEARRITAYFTYVLGRDTSYLATLRKSGGEEWVASPAFQALAQLDRGDTASATRIAAQFSRGDTTRIRTVSQESMLGSFVEAEVLATIGDLRGAAATYESIDPVRAKFSTFGFPDPRWPLYARTFLQRGKLYERLGEKPKAEAAYKRFLELWKDADRRLQPQLQQARDGLARLRDS
ncbi:MAG: protein kinase domain-containing protein [Gemmatimonadaceae bacterium]